MKFFTFGKNWGQQEDRLEKLDDTLGRHFVIGALAQLVLTGNGTTVRIKLQARTQRCLPKSLTDRRGRLPPGWRKLRICKTSANQVQKQPYDFFKTNLYEMSFVRIGQMKERKLLLIWSINLSQYYSDIQKVILFMRIFCRCTHSIRTQQYQKRVFYIFLFEIAERSSYFNYLKKLVFISTP